MTGFKHGMWQTPTYKSWQMMKVRCLNSNYNDYKNYGGRGITLCEEWKNSFTKFLEDMGERPSLKYSLDRINNNGNYCKENCKWSTRKEQSRNTRSSVNITWKGKSQSVDAWAEELNISKRCLGARIERGWPTERAFTQPIQKRTTNLQTL